MTTFSCKQANSCKFKQIYLVTLNPEKWCLKKISSLKPRPWRVQKAPSSLIPSLTFFRLWSLPHSFSPRPCSIEVGLTGRVSKQVKGSPGRLIGRNRQMRHALTGGDVGWVVGSMLCQPGLSWSGQLVNPWHGHSPTWGPVLAGSATSGHPITSWHHYGWDQVGPSPVGRVAHAVDNAILLAW